MNRTGKVSTVPGDGCPNAKPEQRKGASDPRLADRKWLERAYADHGDMWIALELGCARGTVRKRREALGIEAAAPGRRLGTATILPSVRGDLDATEAAFRRRYHSAKQRKVPATEDTLVAAIKAAHDARHARIASAYDDSLIDIAAAAALIHDHRQKLRRAA